MPGWANFQDSRFGGTAGQIKPAAPASVIGMVRPHGNMLGNTGQLWDGNWGGIPPQQTATSPIGGISYRPRPQNGFQLGAGYRSRPGTGMYANFYAQHPKPLPPGMTMPGVVPPEQAGWPFPFNFSQQLGLGDFYTPHGPGDAQNVANSTVGANFIGNQWGQVPAKNAQQPRPGAPVPTSGYAPRRYY